MLKKRLFFALTLGLLSCHAMATDVFGFLLPACRVESGVPVAYEDGQLTVLRLNGSLVSFPAEDLVGIGHYVLTHSAFDLTALSPEATALGKKFEIKDENLFLRGFPYQFLDGTIFILDRQGARRVLGQDEIGRVQNVQHWDDEHKAVKHPVPSFALPSGISQCQIGKAGVAPVRFMADKIQILETVNDWEKGFRDMNDLAERSQFYPRPFLFDRHDRFGFFMFNSDRPQPEVFPIRYSFTNGADFRFQGQTSFGGGFDTIGPVTTPQTLLATDLKFHFLHASFEGNTPAMGIGSSFFAKESKYTEYAEKHVSKALGGVGFNHLALIGGDWQNWGLSFGPMYPVFYVQAGPEAREATPQKSLPIVRLTWTGETVKLKLSAARGSLKSRSDVQKKMEVISGEAGTDAHADRFKINFSYVRFGVDWNAADDTRLTSDLIVKQWDYQETLQGNGLSFNSREVSLLSSLNRNFSRYVSLGVFLLYTRPEDKGTYSGITYRHNPSIMNYGGTFEFLF